MRNPILEAIESCMDEYCYFIRKEPEWYKPNLVCEERKYKGYIINPVYVSSMMIIYKNSQLSVFEVDGYSVPSRFNHMLFFSYDEAEKAIDKIDVNTKTKINSMIEKD